jgi:hypothetical protein
MTQIARLGGAVGRQISRGVSTLRGCQPHIAGCASSIGGSAATAIDKSSVAVGVLSAAAWNVTTSSLSYLESATEATRRDIMSVCELPVEIISNYTRAATDVYSFVKESIVFIHHVQEALVVAKAAAGVSVALYIAVRLLAPSSLKWKVDGRSRARSTEESPALAEIEERRRRRKQFASSFMNATHSAWMSTRKLGSRLVEASASASPRVIEARDAVHDALFQNPPPPGGSDRCPMRGILGETGGQWASESKSKNRRETKTKRGRGSEGEGHKK